jgi:serine/threonine-protein kinase
LAIQGSSIGSYQLVDKLGEGGMGVIWLAKHSLLGRCAAMKILLPGFSANPELVQRFFNEARAATAIGDPGIVQIFDFGLHTDGSAYIVMELLDGESLGQRIERCGRLPTREAVAFGRQIAMSLAAAHAKNVVHRDLKPENVFVVPDPAVLGGERTKVLDFGIAKLDTNENPLKTQTGAWLGTPVYASPEQCRSLADVDHRSDIYSLGCMLYCMVTGRPPFETGSSGDAVAAHIRDRARPPSSIAPDVPASLDAMIARCLEKDPERRYQSMHEVASALAKIDAPHAPVVVAGPSDRTVALRKHPTTLTGASGQYPSATTILRGRRRGHRLLAFCLLAIALFGASAFLTNRFANDTRIDGPATLATPAAATTPPTETAAPASARPPAAELNTSVVEPPVPSAPPATAVAPQGAAATKPVEKRAVAEAAQPMTKLLMKRKLVRRASKRKAEHSTRVDDPKPSHADYVDRGD